MARTFEQLTEMVLNYNKTIVSAKTYPGCEQKCSGCNLASPDYNFTCEDKWYSEIGKEIDEHPIYHPGIVGLRD